MRRLIYGFVLLVFGLILAGCAQGRAEAAPPEINYGVDACAHCTMIISDPRFAAGLAHELSPGRYESLPYDDIGDLLSDATAHPERKVVAYYVHDYTTEEWLEAPNAFFVQSKAVMAPMGSGLAAHATREAAEAMAAELDGAVLTWEELQARGLAHAEHSH